MNKKLEYCCYCAKETGNAGIHDGSNYLESGVGPLCDSCYDDSPEGKVALAEDKIEKLKNAECGKCGRSLAPDGDCHGCRADRLEADLAEARAMIEKLEVRVDEPCDDCATVERDELRAVIERVREVSRNFDCTNPEKSKHELCRAFLPAPATEEGRVK